MKKIVVPCVLSVISFCSVCGASLIEEKSKEQFQEQKVDVTTFKDPENVALLSEYEIEEARSEVRKISQSFADVYAVQERIAWDGSDYGTPAPLNEVQIREFGDSIIALQKPLQAILKRYNEASNDWKLSFMDKLYECKNYDKFTIDEFMKRWENPEPLVESDYSAVETLICELFTGYYCECNGGYFYDLLKDSLYESYRDGAMEVLCILRKIIPHLIDAIQPEECKGYSLHSLGVAIDKDPYFRNEPKGRKDLIDYYLYLVQTDIKHLSCLLAYCRSRRDVNKIKL